jgi:Uma2 family endonuclease
MLEVDPAILEQRRRSGADLFDEMWEGVLHMVPMPAERHQRLAAKLTMILGPLAEARGLRLAGHVGFYRVDDDYRGPDLAVYRPEQASRRGLEGAAEMVIEIVSPRDESREKLPWYAARGVREIFLVDRDTLEVERYEPVGGEPVRTDHTRSEVLDCAIERIDDDRLRVGDAVIDLSS